MEEIWKDIEGFEGKYQISTYGRVKSIPRLDSRDRVVHGRILRPKRDGGGYLNVCLCINGHRYYEKIHRLVAKAFIPNPEDKPTVNHLDENIKNNRLDNLEWATYKENANYGTRLERCYKYRDYAAIGKNISKGKRAKGQCRAVAQYDKDMNKISEWESVVDACKVLNYVSSGISGAARGDYPTYKGFIWKYI